VPVGCTAPVIRLIVAVWRWEKGSEEESEHGGWEFARQKTTKADFTQARTSMSFASALTALGRDARVRPSGRPASMVGSGLMAPDPKTGPLLLSVIDIYKRPFRIPPSEGIVA
jgi:hypothetical protein